MEGVFHNGVIVPDNGATLPEGTRVRILPAEVPPASRKRGYSSDDVEAILHVDKPAPDDETVKRWIEEHRLEKYGR